MGITEVVYNQGYLVDDQTAKIFEEGGVKLRQFSPPAGGLIDLGGVWPSREQHERGQTVCI